MDAETALELVKQGVTLLFLDVPQNTLLGIDSQVYFPPSIILQFSSFYIRSLLIFCSSRVTFV